MSRRERRLTTIMLSEPGQEPKIELKGYPVDAKRDVRINGTVRDVLRGIAGHTIGCLLSNCGTSNKSAFPHPVLLVSVTPKNFIVVTKIRKNNWADMVLYHHSYGMYVDLNDRGVAKKIVKERPAWAEKEFLLRRPSRGNGRPGSSGQHTGGGHKKPYAPKGALGRAVKAGLIAPGVARSLQSA